MRKTRFAAFAGLMILMAAYASAAANEFEADVFYNSAQGYMKDGDYENALMSVYRAKDIYTSIANKWGVERCDSLIAQVEALLAPPQLAEKYYNIAGTYYTQGRDDPEILNRAVEMATRARDIYITVGGGTGSTGKLKCDDLIASARTRINEIINLCVKNGDETYDKAQTAYLNNYLVEAKSYALNASEKYTSCNYPRGVETAGALITSINNRINDLRVQGKASYDKALQYYALNTPDDHLRCIEYANSSQIIFLQIDDQEDYNMARTLESRCRGGINEYEELKKREAADYMNEAKRQYILQDYANATDNANKAKDIYAAFLQKAREDEIDLPFKDQVKTQLYESFMNDVNSLLARITQSGNFETNLRLAQELYRKSQDYYLSNDLNEALAYANNAKSIFTSINNFVGMTMCDTLINQINQRVSQRNDASAALDAAEGYMGVASFDQAEKEALKAKAIYAMLYDKGNEDATDAFLARVADGRKNLAKANKVLENAQRFNEAKDCQNVITEGNNALQIYRSLNYSMGIDKSRELVTACEATLKQEWDDFVRNAAIVGVLFTLSAILIYQFLTRKKAIEKEYKERNTKADEDIRRKGEELKIRSDEDTKSMVDDELRKLIEAERNKLDEN